MAGGGAGTCRALGSHAVLPFALVGQHFKQFRLVSLVGYHRLVQLALPGTALRRQDVTCKSMIPNHFTSARFLEALGRTFMGLQFRHIQMSFEGSQAHGP
jgi:hypothetical protein